MDIGQWDQVPIQCVKLIQMVYVAVDTLIWLNHQNLTNYERLISGFEK